MVKKSRNISPLPASAQKKRSVYAAAADHKKPKETQPQQEKHKEEHAHDDLPSPSLSLTKSSNSKRIKKKAPPSKETKVCVPSLKTRLYKRLQVALIFLMAVLVAIIILASLGTSFLSNLVILDRGMFEQQLAKIVTDVKFYGDKNLPILSRELDSVLDVLSRDPLAISLLLEEREERIKKQTHQTPLTLLPPPDLPDEIALNSQPVEFRSMKIQELDPFITNSTFKPKHPIILLPGIVSSKLEVWKSKECASSYFRECFWGSRIMLQNLLLNRNCWLEHISLDMNTGLDPEGIKLRPMTGLSAADYLVGDYWVWGKMILNLAAIGYEPSSMHLASYDWRLSFFDLEKRDFFFSSLKKHIEFFVKTCPTELIIEGIGHCEKVAVVAHSMGSLVWMYFMKWVENPLPHGGGGGENWINDHIAHFVNIGGPMLGVPKAISGLISGEMKDTVELNSVAQFIKENFISRDDILRLFRSFPSITSMLPKGGSSVWGDGTNSPEDQVLSDLLQSQISFPSDDDDDDHQMIGKKENTDDLFTDNEQQEQQQGIASTNYFSSIIKFSNYENEKYWDTLFGRKKSPHESTVSATISGEEKDTNEVPKSEKEKEKRKEGKKKEEEEEDIFLQDLKVCEWDSPRIQPPFSPEARKKWISKKNLRLEDALDLLRELSPEYMRRIDSLYSFDITRNIEQLKKNHFDPKFWTNPLDVQLPFASNMKITCLYGTNKETERGYFYRENDNIKESCSNVPIMINDHLSSPMSPSSDGLSFSYDSIPSVTNGIVMADGDGTVPLISLGLMCSRGWKKDLYNPSRMSVKTKEYQHLHGILPLRGLRTGDHVDILGNIEMLSDVIKLVTGHEIDERIVSRIIEISEKADI